MADVHDADAGPNTAPPSLPVGWIAQWDGSSRTYYYVQISTGKSVWEIPTEDAPLVPTPGTTPAQSDSPYSKPNGNGMGASDGGRTVDRGRGGPQDSERGLGSMAMNAILGQSGNKQGQHSSGLGGLAQQLLSSSGQSSHNQSHGSGSGGMLGSLASSFLGGDKPAHGPQHGSSGQSGHGGLGGMMNSFLGGESHHNQQQGFGYTSNGKTGVYNGQAPPSSYQPGAYGQSYGTGSASIHGEQPAHDPSAQYTPGTAHTSAYPQQSYSDQARPSEYGSQGQQAPSSYESQSQSQSQHSQYHQQQPSPSAYGRHDQQPQQHGGPPFSQPLSSHGQGALHQPYVGHQQGPPQGQYQAYPGSGAPYPGQQQYQQPPHHQGAPPPYPY